MSGAAYVALGEGLQQEVAAAEGRDAPEMCAHWCRAGSSPHVVLLTDNPLAPGQKTPERGSSRLSASAEAHPSLLHEPGSPGKHMQVSQGILP